MAGHSKWANIKHKKARSDAKKGKVFSRAAKEIINAVKQGGSDPKSNAKLKLALQRAKDANVPNENIERNIKKALSTDQADFTEMTYELYGHGGVGIVVDIMTDNKNRISSEMKIATNKRGGSIASPGSVQFNFDRKGVLRFTKEHGIEDELFMAATDAGAEDFVTEDEGYVIFTDPQDFMKVKDAVEALGFKCDEAELEMVPKVTVDCNEEDGKKNLELIEWLEDLDDVDAVYHNMS